MNPHTHFDVDAAMAALRRTMARTTAQGLALPLTDENRTLLLAQARLDEAALMVHRWMLEMHNEHVPLVIREQALGTMLGNLLGTFATNAPGDARPKDVVTDTVVHALTTARHHLGDPMPVDVIDGSAVFEPVRGGTA